MMKKLVIVIGLLFFCANSAFAYSFPRWGNFPLNVYVADEKNAPVVQKAFKNWQANSNYILKFFFRKGKNFERTAHINVYFVDYFYSGKYYSIYRKNCCRNKNTPFFTRIDIRITQRDAFGREFSEQQKYGILMQAIGSAMGISCLSTSGDVMSCNTDFKRTTLTANDIRALTSVYKYEKSTDRYKFKS